MCSSPGRTTQAFNLFRGTALSARVGHSVLFVLIRDFGNSSAESVWHSELLRDGIAIILGNASAPKANSGLLLLLFPLLLCQRLQRFEFLFLEERAECGHFFCCGGIELGGSFVELMPQAAHLVELCLRGAPLVAVYAAIELEHFFTQADFAGVAAGLFIRDERLAERFERIGQRLNALAQRVSRGKLGGALA